MLDYVFADLIILHSNRSTGVDLSSLQKSLFAATGWCLAERGVLLISDRFHLSSIDRTSPILPSLSSRFQFRQGPINFNSVVTQPYNILLPDICEFVLAIHRHLTDMGCPELDSAINHLYGRACAEAASDRAARTRAVTGSAVQFPIPWDAVHDVFSSLPLPAYDECR